MKEETRENLKKANTELDKAFKYNVFAAVIIIVAVLLMIIL